MQLNVERRVRRRYFLRIHVFKLLQQTVHLHRFLPPLDHFIAQILGSLTEEETKSSERQPKKAHGKFLL